jgi:hypothetical protein
MTKARIAKKFVAIATTMLMLALMVMPAAAAPGTGKITVHKYAGQSTENALPNFTGAGGATIHSDFSPLEDAGFTIYQLPNNDITTQVIDHAVGGRTITGHSINATGATPVVTWTFSDGPTRSVTAVAVAWGTELITPASGTIVFDGGSLTGAIPDGWYVLVETTPVAGHIPANPSLIQMPLTLDDAAGTINRDIHVYPKNVETEGKVNKDMSGVDQPVETNDELDFQLKAKFQGATVNSAEDLRTGTAPSANPDHYGIARIEERFNLYFEQVGNDSNIRVNWLDSTGEEIEGGALPATHYTISRTAATATAGEIIRVQLTPAGIDAAITADAPGFGIELRAKYIGTPSAGPAPAATVTNVMSAMILAPMVEEDEEQEIIDETHVPTISIQGLKVKQSDGTPLAGATFKLSKVAVNPQANDFVKDASNNDLVVTTGPDGVFSFSNLPGYLNATGLKLYLIETVTPAGYNAGTIQTIIWENQAWYFADDADNEDADGNWAENVNLVKAVTVVNTEIGTPPLTTPGFSLPLTGGAGTLLFTAIGIIVMLGATGAYLHGKKRNLEK